ncbi:hypothetical protein ANO11243_079030 [Dothideomycetidae sp. 11243]|nr:hypothetical protein ANO11243_079030 [fungal sp. No.11243]
MNRTSLFDQKFFQPAAEYLKQSVTAARAQSQSLLGATVELGGDLTAAMDLRQPRSSSKKRNELTPRSIPLIDISRSPSPLARIRSAAQSEDESDFEIEDAAQSRPLVKKSANAYSQQAPSIFQRGSVGHFLFGTSIGSQVYIALLVFWVGGCQFGLLLMNRFILWTGLYK